MTLGVTLDDLIARLHDGGRLRVWSLAVTFFGDAVLPRGGAIAMSDLSASLERLGVEPGAVRTAMSRLARDGYVVRRKEGRRSFYRLSEGAAAEFEAAGRRIYAPAPPDWDGRWTVALGQGEDDADALGAEGFRRITPGVWLAPGRAAPPASMFAIAEGRGAPPDWARELLSPPELVERYATLAAAWEGFDPHAAEGLDAMAARTLLIHDWRRILLRDPPLPRALRPAGWPGAQARDIVAAAYAALRRSSETWLDGCEAAPDETLPPPTPVFAARFRA